MGSDASKTRGIRTVQNRAAEGRRRRGVARKAAAVDSSTQGIHRLINRELSWLAFNARVLEEVLDDEVPLLERLKFAGIAASNLDEFFMVRVAGLLEQATDSSTQRSQDGMTPEAQIREVAARASAMLTTLQATLVDNLIPALSSEGLHLALEASDVAPTNRHVDAYFEHSVFPLLTPLAIDPGHPFPFVRNKSLNLLCKLTGEFGSSEAATFGVVQVPDVLARLVSLDAEDAQAFVLLEAVIARNIRRLFPGFQPVGAWPFRVLRNSDLSLDEEGAEDLLESVEEEVRRRQRGRAVCLIADASLPHDGLSLLQEALDVPAGLSFAVPGPLDAPGLLGLARHLSDVDALNARPFRPQATPALQDAATVFEAVSQRDLLLHHPYERFDPVVRFIEEAAADPEVLAIKQTLYRTSGDSPIVKALIRAAEAGKQVTALVEVKARFDEENNIQWARALEEAGVHVVYGLVGLKTHCKVALVIRREGARLRRYVHLGTGNYNPHTAKIYTDLSFFTAQESFGSDATQLFNMLTSCTVPERWERLMVAPLDLHSGILSLIQGEAEAARRGEPARILAKMNSLVDPEIIEALYDASAAGVTIDLIVRGVCCLRAGVPGLSEGIRVISVVDRFLEHARVFVFHNGGNRRVFAGSADWMQRNFHRRVEVLFPIEEASLQTRLVEEILEVQLRDNVKARELRPDDTYGRVARTKGQLRSQLFAMETAEQAARAAAALARQDRPFLVRPTRMQPSRGTGGAGLEPRAVHAERAPTAPYAADGVRRSWPPDAPPEEPT